MTNPAELKLVSGSSEWKVLRERAKNDLFWLADVVLGYGSLVPITLRAHYLMCRFAERGTGVKVLDDAHVREILVPRGVGKSTLVTQSLTIQKLLRDPNTAILIANETERGATKFLGEIEHHFESNEFLRTLFPELIPPDFRQTKWSETEATITRTISRKESSVMAVGVGAAITGLHPDTIILDDLISDEAMENARAGVWSLMDKAKRWIDRLVPLVNRGAPFWEIIIVGTRWWDNDIYEHVDQSFGYGQEPKRYTLSARIEDGETQSLEVARKGDVAIFKRSILENGTSWFKERWPDEELAKLRVTDPVLFAANLLNDPRAPEVTLFKPGWRRYYSWATDEVISFTDQEGKPRHERIIDLDIVASVDPAFTEGGTTDSRQALLVTGTTDDGLHHVLVADATRVNVEAFIGRIVTTCQRLKPRKLLIERAAQQSAFILDVSRRLAAANCRTVVDEVTPGGKNKDVRIATLESWFQRGLIYGHRDQADFWNEYDSFPRSRFKDLLDALAYQITSWRTLDPASSRSPAAERRIQNELRILHQRLNWPVAPNTPKDPGKYREDGSKRW